MNGKVKSLEGGDIIDPCFIMKPVNAIRQNEIDFIFSEDEKLLSCTVHFMSFIVSKTDIALK